MEDLLATDEYAILFKKFMQDWDDELNKNEKYALDQMQKLTLLSNLFAR